MVLPNFISTISADSRCMKCVLMRLSVMQAFCIWHLFLPPCPGSFPEFYPHKYWPSFAHISSSTARETRLHFIRLNVCVCIISAQGQWGRSQKVHAAHGKQSFPWQGLVGLRRSSTQWCENDGGVFSGNEAVFRFIPAACLPGIRFVLQRSLWNIYHSTHVLIIQQNTIY